MARSKFPTHKVHILVLVLTQRSDQDKEVSNE